MTRQNKSEGDYFTDAEWDIHRDQLAMANTLFDQLAKTMGLRKTAAWRGCWPSCGVEKRAIIGINYSVNITLEDQPDASTQPTKFAVNWSLWKSFLGLNVRNQKSGYWYIKNSDLNNVGEIKSAIEEALLKCGVKTFWER
jgi:hypothetical protein